MYESVRWLEDKVDSYLFGKGREHHSNCKSCCVVCNYLNSDMSVNEYVLKNEMHIHLLRRTGK